MVCGGSIPIRENFLPSPGLFCFCFLKLSFVDLIIVFYFLFVKKNFHFVFSGRVYFSPAKYFFLFFPGKIYFFFSTYKYIYYIYTQVNKYISVLIQKYFPTIIYIIYIILSYNSIYIIYRGIFCIKGFRGIIKESGVINIYKGLFVVCIIDPF